MAQESVQLEKKIKRLENKVKKLKAAVEEEKEMGEYRIKNMVKAREEKEELRNKIFELEQQLDAQETKGPVYQICDPSLQYFHKRRDLGVDVYVERHRDDTKFLLTRIPIILDSELCEDMTFEQRAATLDPLVRGLRSAYSKSEEPLIHIDVSINEMYWTED